MNTVVVGKIGAPNGVKGWFKVHSFTNPPANLFTYPLLIETHKEGWRSVEFEAFREHGDGFVAKLAEINDRDQAALITNAQLGVTREDLPEIDTEEGEFYWADLLGLTVYNQDDIELGQLADIMVTGANDVMVVQGKKKQHLIPLVLEIYILDVDLEAKRMRVHWDPEF